MTSRLGRWLRDPLFLLCLTAGLLAFVVQSGEMGTADTSHRLQTTHWLWTSEPQVFPYEYPEFGLHGRGGRLYSWYGIGQSLLMLPTDVVGTWIAHWPVFSEYEDDPSVRSIVVSTSATMLIDVLTALVAFRLLGQLRFSKKESVAGVLALLLCTTHLHYTQNMMENNYIMLLTLAGFSFQYEWLRTDSQRALFVGSGALGLNLLTRLTTGLDLIAGGVFVLLVLWFGRAVCEEAAEESLPDQEQQPQRLKPHSGQCSYRSGKPLRHPKSSARSSFSASGKGVRGRELWQRLVEYCKVAAPVYLFFLLIDRAYQFYRFGSFTNTYVPIFAREQRQIDPTLPANFPWSTPFHVGFLGALFKPEKSIFLFDPLLVLAIVLLAWLWKRITPEVRAYGATTLLLLLAYICFYARYTYWAGDFAWGDRYVSTSVELAALIGVPLLMRYREHLGKTIWRVGCVLILVSLMVQLASLAFWLSLEIYQMETLGHPTFVIALRCKNIAAFALGKMDAWGLNNVAMTQDPWDYVHVSTWNFLPFVLRRVGVAPGWAVNTVLAIWLAGIATLGAVLLRLRRCLREMA
ncbi:MAG: hypothetical protein ABSD64_00725 [Terriglobales bacterium]|jgi:hypothetical protein